MPQETKSDAGHAHAERSESLQGWTVDLSDEAVARDVLDKAFDFRGDTVLTLVTGEEVEGYIFDRRTCSKLEASQVRLLVAGSPAPRSVSYDQIQRVAFGKDTAHGKSFETWVKKFTDARLAGKEASIH